jgi:biotin carboxyl carrier protein
MRLDAEVAGRRVAVTVRKKTGGYEVLLDDRRVLVDARPTTTGAWSLLIDGRSYDVGVQSAGDVHVVRLAGAELPVRLSEAGAGGVGRTGDSRGPARLVAPMPGKVVRVLVAPGDPVAAGDGLVVVEAMKMENELRAGRAGRVAAVHVREGQPVDGGALLVELE